MSLEVAIQNLADAINNLANASGQTKLSLNPAKDVDLSNNGFVKRLEEKYGAPDAAVVELPEPAKAEAPAPAKGKAKGKAKAEPAPEPAVAAAVAATVAAAPAVAQPPQTTSKAPITLDEARARFAAKAREPGIGLAKVQALIKSAGVATIASLEPSALAALLAKAEALT